MTNLTGHRGCASSGRSTWDTTKLPSREGEWTRGGRVMRRKETRGKFDKVSQEVFILTEKCGKKPLSI